MLARKTPLLASFSASFFLHHHLSHHLTPTTLTTPCIRFCLQRRLLHGFLSPLNVLKCRISTIHAVFRSSSTHLAIDTSASEIYSPGMYSHLISAPSASRVRPALPLFASWSGRMPSECPALHLRWLATFTVCPHVCPHVYLHRCLYLSHP